MSRMLRRLIHISSSNSSSRRMVKHHHFFARCVCGAARISFVSFLATSQNNPISSFLCLRFSPVSRRASARLCGERVVGVLLCPPPSPSIRQNMLAPYFKRRQCSARGQTDSTWRTPTAPPLPARARPSATGRGFNSASSRATRPLARVGGRL